jgi:hypothetical protein
MASRYQPCPFFEVDFTCLNCEERYQIIKGGKSLLDFYSANCYFGFRFLQDGGESVEAVETNEEIRKEVNHLAQVYDLNLICHAKSQDIKGESFDTGLLLDSYGYSDTPEFVEILLKRCKTSYVSAPSRLMNLRLEGILRDLFKNVSPVYEGEDGKIIYKCQK